MWLHKKKKKNTDLKGQISNPVHGHFITFQKKKILTKSTFSGSKAALILKTLLTNLSLLQVF